VTPLPAKFYARPTAEVARSLLGHILVSDVGGARRRTAGRIVEVEAYVGPHDPACHAFGHRRTPRTEQLYGAAGTAYVYFTYGMHWCLNAVTEAEDYPAAVLIRALEPVAGLEIMRRRRGRGIADRHLCAGPARLCEALGVTGQLNGARLQQGPLRIVRSQSHRGRIAKGPRVGITRALDWPLRFFFQDSPWVSR
jgi:DNA-3-methyladenine glycosylase